VGQAHPRFAFSSVEGLPLRRNNFRRRYWLPAVRDAGLEPLRFHDLRHTCASLLIAQGAHVKEIQMRLGHSSITTTMNVYGHLLPSLDQRLSEGLDEMYRAARHGKQS
jgi:integrase